MSLSDTCFGPCALVFFFARFLLMKLAGQLSMMSCTWTGWAHVVTQDPPCLPVLPLYVTAKRTRTELVW